MPDSAESRARTVLLVYFPMFIATLSLVTSIYNGYLNNRFLDFSQRSAGRTEYLKTCKEIIDAYFQIKVRMIATAHAADKSVAPASAQTELATAVARFGALDAELWRAIRLVTDTGIHLKGWTRQQTLDYMYANSPAEQTRAVSEAERFAAIPGQALAYKIGQLKIVELRKRAEKELGAKFDVKEFHDEVLKDGAIPLDVLDAKINRWIASKK